MPKFEDAKGNEWNLSLTVLLIEEVREKADPLFLIESPEHDTYERMSSDPVLMCQVVHVLCGKQIEDRKMTVEQFYSEDCIGHGDVIQAAGEALLEAIINFTRPREREVRKAGAAVNNKVKDIATQKAMAKINDPALLERITAELDRKLEEVVERALTGLSSATNSPASSESDQTS